MSGPVTASDDDPVAAADAPTVGAVEVTDPRRAEVGGFAVGRLLPRRARRMVGPWCFVDRMGPGAVDEARSLDVGPHPHIGLQTVTWLVRGSVLHRDSLGSEQLIRPGQLNLMTAGHGVSHSEETRGVYSGELHGVQLWVAQPEATRAGAAAFEHHAELPIVALGAGRATVLVGEFAGAVSPARADTRHVAAELHVSQGRTVVALDAGFEHAVVALDEGVSAGGQAIAAGHLGYLGSGRDEVVLDASEPARLLLIGGAPFPEPVLMWWNYVARSRSEIVTAHAEWTARAERFGRVATALASIDATPPPWPPE